MSAGLASAVGSGWGGGGGWRDDLAGELDLDDECFDDEDWGRVMMPGTAAWLAELRALAWREGDAGWWRGVEAATAEAGDGRASGDAVERGIESV